MLTVRNGEDVLINSPPAILIDVLNVPAERSSVMVCEPGMHSNINILCIPDCTPHNSFLS